MVFISEPHCTRVPVPGMLLRRQEFPNSNRIPFIKSFELHNVVEDSGNEWNSRIPIEFHFLNHLNSTMWSKIVEMSGNLMLGTFMGLQLCSA